MCISRYKPEEVALELPNRRVSFARHQDLKILSSFAPTLNKYAHSRLTHSWCAPASST